MSLNNFYTQKNTIFDNERDTMKELLVQQSKQVIQTSDVNITDSDLDMTVALLQ